MTAISIKIPAKMNAELKLIDYDGEGYNDRCDLIRDLLRKWLSQPRKKLK